MSATLVSMTGFGRGAASGGGVRADVEVSSVNRRQFDVRMSLPRGLTALEPRLHRLIQDHVARGQIVLNLRLGEAGRPGGATIRVDMDAARGAVRALRRAGKALGLTDTLGTHVLLDLPHVVEFLEIADDPERVWPVIEKALGQALENLLRMRRREGRALERDLRARLASLEKLLRHIGRCAPAARKRHEDTLRDRLRKAGADVAAVDSQLMREVVLYAERVDITEETVRMQSHFAHARDIMGDDKPAGRALDFLCQEMMREINTIGAKANDADIARAVVTFKAEVESIREQVQNVE